jgi:uncharacterized protein DUF4157
MRMPWQRRSAGRAEPENAAPPEAMPHAWRSAPPLARSAGGPPPLTARSVELAESLSRRLRSTRERPPLVHRVGLPDPAAPGTVRGIAVASPRTTIRAGSASSAALSDSDTASDASETTVAPTPTPSVKARRVRRETLTTVDPAALVFPVREPAPRDVVEVESSDTAIAEAPQPSTGPPTGMQRTVVRRRMGAPGSRPLGLQAPLDEAATKAEARTAELARSAQQVSIEPAPHAVTAEVGRLHRADVGNVRVHRGEEAERVAADAHARAVTRGGEVFIPDAAGNLDSGAGRGLLAHELTHVIQQRRLGSSVPLEHSPAGRRLESEASMTERHVRGDAGAPAPPPAASQPAAPASTVTAATPPADDDVAKATARELQDELIASGRAFRMPDGSIVFPGSGMHLPQQRTSQTQPAVAMQRAPDDPTPAAADAPAPASGTPYTPPSDTGFLPMPAMPVTRNATPSPAGAPSASQSWSQPVAAAAPTSTASPAPAAAPQTADAPAPEPAPPIDIDDLARRVYGQVRTQLRSELLIDRERAGLLTDFR